MIVINRAMILAYNFNSKSVVFYYVVYNVVNNLMDTSCPISAWLYYKLVLLSISFTVYDLYLAVAIYMYLGFTLLPAYSLRFIFVLSTIEYKYVLSDTNWVNIVHVVLIMKQTSFFWVYAHKRKYTFLLLGKLTL